MRPYLLTLFIHQESKKESEEKFKVCVLLFLFFVDCETFSFFGSVCGLYGT